jgi:hypothetical protein
MYVTEAEWLLSADPDWMLRYLGDEASVQNREAWGYYRGGLLKYLKDEASDRKLRLLACAWCRRLWDHLPDERSRRAVETSERYADGLASKKELSEVRAEAAAAAEIATSNAAKAALYTTTRPASHGVLEVAWYAHCVVLGREQRAQAALVRDVFGNPFRPPSILDSSWLSWQGGAVLRIAQGVYNDRLDDLPILGDALVEAGCTDEEIFRHCRQAEEHVRGCWVLDLLLGKM